eukprot:gene11227-15067_t
MQIIDIINIDSIVAEFNARASKICIRIPIDSDESTTVYQLDRYFFTKRQGDKLSILDEVCEILMNGHELRGYMLAMVPAKLPLGLTTLLVQIIKKYFIEAMEENNKYQHELAFIFNDQTNNSFLRRLLRDWLHGNVTKEECKAKLTNPLHSEYISPHIQTMFHKLFENNYDKYFIKNNHLENVSVNSTSKIRYLEDIDRMSLNKDGTYLEAALIDGSLVKISSKLYHTISEEKNAYNYSKSPRKISESGRMWWNITTFEDSREIFIVYPTQNQNSKPILNIGRFIKLPLGGELLINNIIDVDTFEVPTGMTYEKTVNVDDNISKPQFISIALLIEGRHLAPNSNELISGFSDGASDVGHEEDVNGSGSSSSNDESKSRHATLDFTSQFYCVFVTSISGCEITIVNHIFELNDHIIVDQIPTTLNYLNSSTVIVTGVNALLGLVCINESSSLSPKLHNNKSSIDHSCVVSTYADIDSYGEELYDNTDCVTFNSLSMDEFQINSTHNTDNSPMSCKSTQKKYFHANNSSISAVHFCKSKNYQNDECMDNRINHVLATGDNVGRVCVWNLCTYQNHTTGSSCVEPFIIESCDRIRTLNVSNHGEIVIVGVWDRLIILDYNNSYSNDLPVLSIKMYIDITNNIPSRYLVHSSLTHLTIWRVQTVQNNRDMYDDSTSSIHTTATSDVYCDNNNNNNNSNNNINNNSLYYNTKKSSDECGVNVTTWVCSFDEMESKENRYNKESIMSNNNNSSDFTEFKNHHKIENYKMQMIPKLKHAKKHNYTDNQLINTKLQSKNNNFSTGITGYLSKKVHNLLTVGNYLGTNNSFKNNHSITPIDVDNNDMELEGKLSNNKTQMKEKKRPKVDTSIENSIEYNLYNSTSTDELHSPNSHKHLSTSLSLELTTDMLLQDIQNVTIDKYHLISTTLYPTVIPSMNLLYDSINNNQKYLNKFTSLFIYDSSEEFKRVKLILAIYGALMDQPYIGLIAAAADISYEETLNIVAETFRDMLEIIGTGEKCIFSFKQPYKSLINWLGSEDCHRIGKDFWIDFSIGHNKLCALYLRFCGNKSVAVEHPWQEYLRNYGTHHLRHSSRGLRDLTRHIRKLDETAGIKGFIPSQIGYISGLQEIYARRVGLCGRIPRELGELNQLRVLSMGNNHLCGEIPLSLGSLKNLQRIVLHQNKLQGTVPDSFGELGCIVNLAGNPGLHHGPDVTTVERNALIDIYDSTKGLKWHSKSNWKTIHPVAKWYKVGVLSSHVHSLVMSNNGMEGKLPVSINNLTHLRMIELATMPGLIGAIPPELCQITTLRRLCICRCSLNGQIPVEIGNLIQLEELQLFGNLMTGSVPSSMSKLINLRLLSLGEYTGGNNFTPQIIPFCISSLVKLEALFMANCNLTGPIPDWIGNLTELRQLDLQRNSLVGTLPPTIGLLKNLLYLNVKDNNSLNGILPIRELSLLHKLNRLSIVHCNFQNLDQAKLILEEQLPRCKIWA